MKQAATNFQHGFLRASNGNFTTFDPADAMIPIEGGGLLNPATRALR